MKNILLYIVVFIFSFLFWILSFCFIMGNTNILSWDELVRFLIIVLSIFTSILYSFFKEK